MDIWNWVYKANTQLSETGHERLADILFDLPTAVTDEDNAKVDALVPEALALCKQQNNPWVELYIRHWNLQSRVLRRDEGSPKLLQEAVSLLDYSSQENTKECPQSICVVQDLASCYENIDNLGYAKERLEVAKETLERINPNWGCYSCISTELLTAKQHLGLHEEALEDIKHYRTELAIANPYDTDKEFVLTEADILKELGRYDEAVNTLKDATRDGGGEHFIHCKKQAMANYYARMGEYHKALENHLPFETVANTLSLGHDWCEASYDLAINDQIANDWQLNHAFEKLIKKWLAIGGLRHGFKHTVLQAKLSIRRKQASSLKQCINRLQLILPQLRIDAGAAEDLAKLEQSLRELPVIEVSLISVENLLESLPEDPEQRLEVLNRGLDKWQDSSLLATEKVATLDLLEKESNAFAEDFLQQYPDSRELLSYYGFAKPNIDFLQGLQTQGIDKETKLNLFWVIGHYFKNHQEKEKSLESFQKILKQDPKAKNTLRETALLSSELEQYKESISYWKRLIKIDPENPNPRWELLIPASISEEWQEVRKQARLLEMDVAESDQPIDEQWSTIRIVYTLDNGETNNYKAIRTGPVTARIISSSRLGEESVYHNELVFNPSPTNALSEKDDDGNDVDEEGYSTYLYPLVKVTKHANTHWKRYDLDGVYPGDKQWVKFTDSLYEKLDIRVLIRSGMDYEIEYKEKNLPAIYAYLMTPASLSLKQLNQHLLELTKEFEHPMIWSLISYLLDDKECQKRNQKVIQDYAISDNDYADLQQNLLT